MSKNKSRRKKSRKKDELVTVAVTWRRCDDDAVEEIMIIVTIKDLEERQDNRHCRSDVEEVEERMRWKRKKNT